MSLSIHDSSSPLSSDEINLITEFLKLQLGLYSDAPSAIKKAIEYALELRPSFGGKVIVARHNDELAGAAVVNKTGMDEYIPENILVYIATHEKVRGKGVGKAILAAVMEHTEGGIALHVDKDNPARHLYEQLGFTTPYLEMRLSR